MKLNYCREEYSKLAWACRIKNNEVDVYHGKNIETREDFFVEGVWDGNFEEGNFCQSEFFLGSGAKICNGKIIFSTPNHTSERLYSFKKEKELYVSNSLPYILSKADLNIDENYKFYERDLNSITKGLNFFLKKLPLKEGFLTLYYYCNFEVDKNLLITEHQKTKTDKFKNYSDYIGRMKECLLRIKENSISSSRSLKYGMATTISKGYDAAATSALALEIGCEVALTFNNPKKYKNDDGSKIAEKLGYKIIIKKNADIYKDNRELIEAEYCSSGELGSMIIFSAFEKEFKDNIVFMGERGDKFWDKNWKDVNSEMRFKGEIFPGTCYIENRLKVGYILCPLPCYGGENWESLFFIANSNEMKNYSIGGNYDRPIPRRILEEKGILREEFGFKKEGAGFNYCKDNLKRIKKRMSNDSFLNFEKYYIRNNKKNYKYYFDAYKYLAYNKNAYFNYIFSKLKVRKRLVEGKEYIYNPFGPSLLFNWGVEVMKKRYSKRGK